MTGDSWTVDMYGKSELAHNASVAIVKRYRAANPSMAEEELARHIAGREGLQGSFTSVENARIEIRRVLYRKSTSAQIRRRIKGDAVRYRRTEHPGIPSRDTMIHALSNDYAREFCDRHPGFGYEEKRCQYEADMTSLASSDPTELTAKFFRLHPPA